MKKSLMERLDFRIYRWFLSSIICFSFFIKVGHTQHDITKTEKYDSLVQELLQVIQSDLEQSVVLFDELAEYALAAKDTVTWTTSLVEKTYITCQFRDYPLATAFSKEITHLLDKLNLPLDAAAYRQVILFHNNNRVGIAIEMGDLPLAKQLCEKGIGIIQAQKDINNVDTTHLERYYINLGSALVRAGNYDASILYFKKADELAKGLGQVSFSRKRMGDAYLKTNRPQQAIPLYLDVLNASLNNQSNSLTKINRIIYAAKGLAQAHQKLENHDSTFHYFNICLDYNKQDQSHQAETFHDLGEAHLVAQNYQQARAYFEQGLALKNSLYLNQKHPEIATSHKGFGDYYAAENNQAYNLDSALLSYQLATIQLIQNFDNQDINSHPKDFSTCLYRRNLLPILHKKGKTFLKKYEQTNELAHIQQAKAAMTSAEALMSFMRHDYRSEMDKRFLVEEGHAVYETSLQVDWHLQATQEVKAHVYQVLEMAKAAVLLDAVRHSEAREFAGLSPDLLERERLLRFQLSNTKDELYQLENKAIEDSTPWATLREKRFQLQETYDAFLDTLERNHPAYVALKFGQKITSLSSLRANLLEENMALLHYFVGEEFIYVLKIEKAEVNSAFYRIPLDFPLQEQITTWSECIKPCKSEASKPTNCATNSVDLTHQFYQKLVAPLGSLPQRLVIIPDDILCYLPFELLLTEAPKSIIAYSEHPYLLRQHSIQYNYSATLWEEMKNKPTSNTDYYAFAPSFPQQKEVLASRSCQIRNRNELDSLRYNVPEIEQIKAIWGGKTWKDRQASATTFLQNCEAAGILHIATHAIFNEENADYSFLAFTDLGDSRATNIHLRDLYNLHIAAKLVILSACETGHGALYKGEGVHSLARGFSYAGAQSVLSSLWSVPDKSTADIMTNFHQYLADGLAKDVALQ